MDIPIKIKKDILNVHEIKIVLDFFKKTDTINKEVKQQKNCTLPKFKQKNVELCKKVNQQLNYPLFKQKGNEYSWLTLSQCCSSSFEALPKHWDRIHWIKIEENVQQLKQKIARASKNFERSNTITDLNDLRVLQTKMINSYDNLLLSLRTCFITNCNYVQDCEISFSKSAKNSVNKKISSYRLCQNRSLTKTNLSKPSFRNIRLSKSTWTNFCLLVYLLRDKINLYKWSPQLVLQRTKIKKLKEPQLAHIQIVVENTIELIISNALDPQFDNFHFCNNCQKFSKKNDDLAASKVNLLSNFYFKFQHPSHTGIFSIDKTIKKIRTTLTKNKYIPFYSKNWALQTNFNWCLETINNEYLINKIKKFPAIDTLQKWINWIHYVDNPLSYAFVKQERSSQQSQAGSSSTDKDSKKLVSTNERLLNYVSTVAPPKYTSHINNPKHKPPLDRFDYKKFSNTMFNKHKLIHSNSKNVFDLSLKCATLLAPIFTHICLYELEKELGIFKVLKTIPVSISQKKTITQPDRTIVRSGNNLLVLCETEMDCYSTKNELEFLLKKRALNLSHFATLPGSFFAKSIVEIFSKTDDLSVSYQTIKQIKGSLTASIETTKLTSEGDGGSPLTDLMTSTQHAPSGKNKRIKTNLDKDLFIQITKLKDGFNFFHLNFRYSFSNCRFVYYFYQKIFSNTLFPRTYCYKTSFLLRSLSQTSFLNIRVYYTLYYQKQSHLIIFPSEKSLHDYKLKLRLIFQSHRGKAVHKLIDVVNPIIRDWTASYSEYCPMQVFSKLDSYILTLQKRYAYRTHPKKSKRWSISRYFYKFPFAGKNHSWVFGDKTTSSYMIKHIWFKQS